MLSQLAHADLQAAKGTHGGHASQKLQQVPLVAMTGTQPANTTGSHKWQAVHMMTMWDRPQPVQVVLLNGACNVCSEGLDMRQIR